MVQTVPSKWFKLCCSSWFCSKLTQRKCCLPPSARARICFSHSIWCIRFVNWAVHGVSDPPHGDHMAPYTEKKWPTRKLQNTGPRFGCQMPVWIRRFPCRGRCFASQENVDKYQEIHNILVLLFAETQWSNGFLPPRTRTSLKHAWIIPGSTPDRA